MYADDLALLAPSRGALQRLLDICYQYGCDWCITYNPLKTKIMIFGKHVLHDPLYLNGSSIDTTLECKYLGVILKSGKEFSCSASKPLSSFLCTDKEREANEILKALREEVANNEYMNRTIHNYFKNKKIMEESKLFKLLNSMPKGGIHHIHTTAAIPIDAYLKATYDERVYYSERE